MFELLQILRSGDFSYYAMSMCGVNYGNDIYVFIYLGYLFTQAVVCLHLENTRCVAD